MKKQSVDVKGLNELLKQLDKLDKDTKKMKKEVLHEAGKHLQSEVKQVAKKLDDFEETEQNKYGTLEDNIWLEWNDKTQTTLITSGNAFWAWFIEYGTNGVPQGARKKNVKKQAPRPNKGMPAHPFMEHTLMSNQKEIYDIVKKEVQKRLDL